MLIFVIQREDCYGFTPNFEKDPVYSNALKQAYDEGLILVSAGSNCLRLAPALNISNEEIEQGISILKKILLGR